MTENSYRKPEKATEWQKVVWWKARVRSEDESAHTVRGQQQPRFILPHLKKGSRDSPAPDDVSIHSAQSLVNIKLAHTGAMGSSSRPPVAPTSTSRTESTRPGVTARDGMSVRSKASSLSYASCCSSCCTHETGTARSHTSHGSVIHNHNHKHGHTGDGQSVRSGVSGSGRSQVSGASIWSSGSKCTAISHRTLDRLNKLESALEEERLARLQAEQDLNEIRKTLENTGRGSKLPTAKR